MTSSRKSVDIVEKSQLKTGLPVFSQGDTVLVDYLVKEGTRERSQPFEGVVIGIKNRGLNSSFIVRKISNGVGVERTFQSHSPLIKSIKVKVILYSFNALIHIVIIKTIKSYLK